MSFTRRKLLQSSSLFLLGACGAPAIQQTNAPSGDARKLVFWTMQLKPTFDAYMTAAIADFEKQNPGATVEWVDVPWSDMSNKILSAIAAKTAPDVVNLNPQFATKLAEKKALLDLEKLVMPEDKALYFPSIWKANQLQEVTFGLPWYVATDICIYNRSILQKAGLDGNRPPKTFAQLQEAAVQIKAKTGKYAFLLTMDGGQVLESMVQMGMQLLTPEGKAAFMDPAGKAAFTYWVDIFQQQLVPRDILTEGHRKAVEMYQAGELAMLLTGPQFLKLVSENAPDIAKVTDVAAQISGRTGKKSAAVMNLAVPTTTTNPELAVKFALFMTDDRNQLAFSKVENSLPSTLKAATDPYFTYLGSEAALADRARVVSASQLSQSEVLIPPAKNIDELRKIIYEELQRTMLKEKSVDAAIASAAQRWNDLAAMG